MILRRKCVYRHSLQKAQYRLKLSSVNDFHKLADIESPPWARTPIKGCEVLIGCIRIIPPKNALVPQQRRFDPLSWNRIDLSYDLRSYDLRNGH
jgi:hypothetical protein